MIGTALKQYFKPAMKLSMQLHSRSQWQKTLQLSARLAPKNLYLFSNEKNDTKKNQTEKGNRFVIIKGKQANDDLPNDNQKQSQITQNSSMLERHIKPQSIQLKKIIEGQQKLDQEQNRMKQERLQESKKAAEEKNKKEKQEEQERKRKEQQEPEKSRFLKWWNKYKTDLAAGGGIVAGLGALAIAFHQYFLAQKYKLQAEQRQRIQAQKDRIQAEQRQIIQPQKDRIQAEKDRIRAEQRQRIQAQKDRIQAEKDKIKERQQNIKTKYGKQKLEVQPYYTQNNETEQQLERLMNKRSYGEGQVIVIGGTAGMGKSTSIKQIANRRRKKGEQFFYFSFRDQNGKQEQITQEFLKLFLQTIKLAKRTAQTIKTTLVVDDINKLKGTSFKKMYQIQRMLCGAARSGVLKVMVISSDSKFMHELRQNDLLRKEGYFVVIQPKSKHDMKRSISNILKYFFSDKQFQKIQTQFESFQIQAKQYLLEQGHSLRNSIKFIGEVKDEISRYLENQTDELDISTIPSVVSILKKLENNKKEEIIEDVKTIFQKQKQTSSILKVLINYKFQNEEIKRFDCNNVWDEIQRITNVQQDKVRDITDKLDEKNILVYCHPRSAFLRNVLKEIFQAMERRSQ